MCSNDSNFSSAYKKASKLAEHNWLISLWNCLIEQDIVSVNPNFSCGSIRHRIAYIIITLP